MDKVRARKLHPYEREKLHRMKRQLTNQVNSRHARIVLLSRGGVRNREIAARADCTPRWVRVVLHRFNDDGIEGIAWYPYFQARTGPRKFLADVREQIAAAALSPPRILIGMNQWSLAKLRQYLIEQKIIADVSLPWLRMLLREAGVRWRRTKTWRDFLAFLKWVRRRYPRSETLHIVLDNYKPHLKTEVLRWADAHRVRFYFTPTSASWLNRIECQFTALRKFALDHSDFRTHEEQQEAIPRYLTWRNGRRAISQTNWKNYRRRRAPTKHAERLAA